MKVIIDTNVLISYLLTPFADRPPARVMNAMFEGRCSLILGPLLLDELRTTIRGKPYLDARIPHARLEGFITRLQSFSLMAREIDRPIPKVTRDPGDDYLIAHAVMERVDYLISGDPDLLDLGTFGDVRIVSPAAFAALLDDPEP